MVKLLTIIWLCVGLSIVSSQCSDTASLRTLYGFDNSVTTATTQSGLKYCKSLQNTQVCCTASDINNLQAKNDALITNLTNMVITRDKYFKQVNTDVLGRLQTAVTKFSDTTNSFAAMPQSADATTQANNAAILETLVSIQAGAGVTLAAYAKDIATMTTNLQAYQSARTTCVVQIAKLQNAAWCLSCDPNAATKGYNPTTKALTLSTNTCTKLKTACYPFVSIADFQGGAIGVQELIDELNAFTALVAKIQAGQTVNLVDFNYVSSGPDVGSVPDSCTSAATCDFICTGLFNAGVINQADLVAGGDTDSGSRRLLEENESRMLQSGSFEPADDEAGTTVTFQNDPGNTNSNQKSGVLSFGSVLIGGIMLLSSYLL